jgi:hypothetical protein
MSKPIREMDSRELDNHIESLFQQINFGSLTYSDRRASAYWQWKEAMKELVQRYPVLTESFK